MDGERTERQTLAELLRAGDWSLRELARELRRPVRDVERDIAHLVRSLGRQALRVEPAVCERCGFVFAKRDRVTAPSRCPRCRSEHVRAPRLRLRAP